MTILGIGVDIIENNRLRNLINYKSFVSRTFGEKEMYPAKKFKKKNIRTSLFINPSLNDIKITKLIGADCVEIHTGKFANLIKSKKNYLREFERIKKCSVLAEKLSIEVHAGHGLDYKTAKLLTKIKQIKEFNIGHYLVGESIFYGLNTVIKNFKKIIKRKI